MRPPTGPRKQAIENPKHLLTSQIEPQKHRIIRQINQKSATENRKSSFFPQKQRNPPKTPLSPSVTKCREVSPKCRQVSQNVTKCHRMSQSVTECHKVSVRVISRFPAQKPSPIVVMVYCLCRKSPKQSCCKLTTRWQQD